MYASFLSSILSVLRSACIVALLLLGAVQEGYGQRVYADVQQSSPQTLLSGVTNQGRPVDNDTSNFSTLSVTLGILDAITVNQNLQYVNRPKPTPFTPINVKFGSTNSLLNILGGFSLQRTNGGRTATIPPAYSGTQLLNLLNILGSGQVGTAIIPPDGQDYDGVRLELNTSLGGLLTGYYYYAFYIVPPQIPSNLTLCANTEGSIAITNFQSGYTYRLYTQEIGGTEIDIATTSNTLSFPSSLDAGTYWLEARESDLYPSARTQITITRNQQPTIILLPNSPICEGETVATLTYNNPANNPDQYSVTWDAGTPIDFTNVTDTTLPSSAIALSIPAVAGMGTYTGVLSVRNSITGCESEGIPFTVQVLPQPGKPNLTITDVQN